MNENGAGVHMRRAARASLLVSPIFFLCARLFHRLAAGHLKVLGVDLAEFRLYRPRLGQPAG